MTLNPFEDLTIHVNIRTPETTFDLSALFSTKMFMAGRDQRQRSFNTAKELLGRGYQLIPNATMIKPPHLCISYEFTFNQLKEIVKIQEYQWNGGWQIV